jgi:hypothetical protein
MGKCDIDTTTLTSTTTTTTTVTSTTSVTSTTTTSITTTTVSTTTLEFNISTDFKQSEIDRIKAADADDLHAALEEADDALKTTKKEFANAQTEARENPDDKGA